MLPTYPRIVDRRSTLNFKRLNDLIVQRAPIYGQIDRHQQFEGAASRITRHDNTDDETEMTKATAEMVFERIPLKDYSLAVVDRKLANIADQLAPAFVQTIVRTMDDVTAKTGQVVNGGGKPMTADLLLQVLDTMEHNFSPNGMWSPPSFMGGGNVSAALSKIQNDPDFQRRLNELLKRKYDDHIRREADRVLAG